MRIILVNFLTCVCIVTGVLAVFPAFGCRYTPKQSSEKIANAPIAFVGTVVEVSGPHNNLVTFKVQKAIRGVKDGELYVAEGHVTSCHNDFESFERWLYLGSDLMSDSLRLENWIGQKNNENIDFVMQQTKIIEASESLSLKGYVENICLQDTEEGFRITLSNGIKATSNMTLDQMHERTRKNVTDSGINSFERCENNKCVQAEGGLHLGDVTAQEISGRFILKEGEKYGGYTFRVERRNNDLACK